MKITLIPVLSLFFICFNLLAEPLPAELSPLLISASPFSETEDKYAGSASIIEPDSLDSPASLSMEDIIGEVPNLTYAGGSSAPRFFQIRGIGELEQYEGAPNPSVGLIFDDFDISGLGLPATLFDLEKIEVLRGPQATKFGANALAGVVAMKSYAPTIEQSVNSRLSIGSDNLLQTGLAFGSGVLDSEMLSFRASVSSEEQDGYRHNLYEDSYDSNKRDRNDARLQFRLAPSKATEVNLEILHALQNDGYDAFSINNAFTTQSDRPGQDKHELNGAKIAFTQELTESLKFSGTSSATSSDLDYGFDGDWGNNPFWSPYDPYDYRSQSNRNRDVVSQELRLEGINNTSGSWLLGLFAQRLDEDSKLSEFSNELIYDSLNSSYKADSLAAFSGFNHKLTETLNLGSSIRVERRLTEYFDSNDKQFSPDFNMQGGSAFIEQQINEQQQIYALISRGFKGGGFNAGTRVPDAQLEYAPETLWNYEVGTKGQAFNNKLDFNISAFLMQRYDQQVKLAIQDDPSDPLAFTYLTDNAAKGNNIGLESESSLQLSDKMRVNFNLGLLKTKITSADQSLSNLQYREQSEAPNWNYALSIPYHFNDRWYFKPSLSGQDEYYFDDSHDQKSNPYHLLGLELGWIKDYLRISLWAKNITDENYAVRGFFFGNEPPDFPNKLYVQRGDPTSFGLTVSYAF